MSTWEQDQKIVSAARSAFGAAIRFALKEGGISSLVMRYLTAVEKLATDFESEPESMGDEMASIWQDRAFELSVASLHDVTGKTRVVTEIAIQVAALVFHAAKRLGGQRKHCQFGWGYMLVRESVRDRDIKVDIDVTTFRFEMLDMMEFVFRRAAELGVPEDFLQAKKARRGL